MTPASVIPSRVRFKLTTCACSVPKYKLVGKNGREVKYYVFRGEKGKRDSFRVLERMTANQADAIAARWRELEGRPAPVAVSKLTTHMSHTPQADRVAEAVQAALVEQIVSPDADQLTMSSLEIAALTGKDISNVHRDIRGMLEALRGEDDSVLNHVESVTDTRGYTTEFKLRRRETDILLTGYSIPMRAKLIDRWHQLETQVAKPVFSVPTSFAEALRLAGELEEQRVALTHQVGVQAAKIAEDAPKAKFHDAVSESEGLKGVSEVAKILGTGEKRLFNYLRKHKILIGVGDTRNMPYQPHLDSGRMDVKWNNYTVPETGEVKIHARPLFTGKGVIWLRKFIEENGRVGL